MSDKKFVTGLYVWPPHESAPEFVKCRVNIKREEFIKWAQAQEGTWIKIDLKVRRDGKWYAEQDTWVPPSKTVTSGGGNPPQEKLPDFEDDKIPFVTNAGIR